MMSSGSRASAASSAIRLVARRQAATPARWRSRRFAVVSSLLSIQGEKGSPGRGAVESDGPYAPSPFRLPVLFSSIGRVEQGMRLENLSATVLACGYAGLACG